MSDCGVKLFPMINVKKQMLIEYMEHLNLDYAKVPLMNDRTSILRSEIIPIMEELAHGKESLRRSLYICYSWQLLSIFLSD